jgi:hypothetical protein
MHNAIAKSSKIAHDGRRQPVKRYSGSRIGEDTRRLKSKILQHKYHYLYPLCNLPRPPYQFWSVLKL